MEKLQSPEKIREDWRTDDFINKQYLCYDLRRCNHFSNYYILKYDVNHYDFHAEQISVKDQAGNTVRLKTYLNKSREIVDLVQRQTEIEFDVDLKEKKLYFRLKYFFHRNADMEELQRNKAIVLETFSYDEFRNLVQYVGYGDFEKDSSYDYLGYFSKIYQFYFQQASTPEQLMFLYTNTPDFVFERMSLEDEKIMDHLLMLTEYDDTGFFSGWKDGSSALVNVLKAFSTNTYILNKFRKEPELCNRIYYNLDGVSFIDGKPQANRLIFANILMQYCLFSPHRPKEDAPTFHIGKNYKIATNVTELSGKWLGLGQSDEKTFFLQQQKEITQNVRIVAKEGNPEATENVREDLDDGKQYFPLEMVYFVNEDEKNINPETGEELPSVTMMVPAIYVKAMADAEKWEDINYFIRITADILAVVLGIATLATTGNPYLILAAMADLSLAGIDLTVQALRKEIAKLPGGEQFLKDWDLIYGVGGAIVAAPQLIVSAYRGIFVLLPNAAKNVQQGLRTMAISLFLDLNSGAFRRQDLRLFQPTEWVIPSAGFFSKTVECDALLQNGAFFMELDAAAIMESINKGSGINPDMIGSISSNRRFALVYKGEIVAEGSRYDKAYQKTLMELKRANYDVEKVGDILEEIINRRRIVIADDISILGSTPEKGIKNSFLLKDEFGNYVGELVRAQEKADKLTYSLKIKGKIEKLNCFTRLLDVNSAKVNRLPVFGDEKMLMGDFNIPTNITNRYSGLGDLILSDAIIFYQSNKKFGRLNGVIGWWKRASMYEDYGGQSINLKKFWEARKAGKSIEDAALSTFTGSRMKVKGFGKVRYNMPENVLEENEVIINFLKK